jgi:hypothetical protein
LPLSKDTGRGVAHTEFQGHIVRATLHLLNATILKIAIPNPDLYYDLVLSTALAFPDIS